VILKRKEKAKKKMKKIRAKKRTFLCYGSGFSHSFIIDSISWSKSKYLPWSADSDYEKKTLDIYARKKLKRGKFLFPCI
jgi:hypothetical protein